MNEGYLSAIYASVMQEIESLRQSQFRAVILSLAMNASVVTFAANDSVLALLGGWQRWAVVLVTSLVVTALVTHLRILHGYLHEQRNLRRRIETLMGAHDGSLLPDGMPLFPVSWNAPVSHRFQLGSLIIPFAAVMALFQIGTVYFLLRVQ